MTLLAQYSYLGTALILLGCVVICAIALKRSRWLLLWAGVLCLPYALFSFEFIPEYWNPRIALWLGACSLEDLLFSSATGALAWFCAAWPFRRRLRFGLPVKYIMGRYLGIAALGVGIGYFLKFTLPNPDVMTSTMVGVVISGMLMFRLRTDAWPLVLSGSLGFSVLYLAIMKLSLMLWPDFISEWQANVPLGYWWGLPVYELVWAFGFGAVWSLLIVFCFNVRIQPLTTPEPSQGGLVPLPGEHAP